MKKPITRVLSVSLSLVALARAANGEEVNATKKAAIMTPIENLYGRVEARQTSMRWKNESGDLQSGVTSYRLIPRLGTTAYNGRFDVYVETPISNEARTSAYSQSTSAYQATFAALQGDMFTIMPFVQGYLPHNGSDFSSDAAVNFDLGKTLELNIGKITFHGSFEPHMASGTEPSRSEAPMLTNGSYALGDNGSPKTKTVDHQEPTTALDYIVGFAYTPAAAPKLSLCVDAFFDRMYTPTYKVNGDGESERMEKTGYSITDSTTTDIVVTYAADKLTSIQSLTRLRHGGLYTNGIAYGSEGRVPQVEQRLSLVQKLF